MFSPETKRRIAHEFAHLQDVVYLNTGLTSVAPRCVQEAYAREMECFVKSYGAEDSWDGENQATREGIARLIGASPDEIALTNNTTAGIAAISLGYPWDKDKNVVIYNREHPSNLYNWFLRQDQGALKVKLVEAPPSGLRVSDLLGAIDEDTQAVAVSAVQYSDGAYVDMVRLGEVCKERGILLIVDGIQALGRMKIDVREMNIDFLASGAHKGLLVRNGVGLIYCRRDLIEKVVPPSASYQSYLVETKAYPPHSENAVHWFPDARRFENGNHNHQGVVALDTSLRLIADIGIENIQARIVELQEYLYQVLGEHAERMRPVSDRPSGIMKVEFDRSKRPLVLDILARHKVYGTVRPGNLRLCVNFFNTEDEMDIAAAAVTEIFTRCGK